MTNATRKTHATADTVYLLRAAGEPSTLKVGITHRLDGRLADLSRHAAVELVAAYGVGCGNALQLERLILEAHRDQRLPQSEWLRAVTPEQLEAIQGLLTRAQLAHQMPELATRPVVQMPEALEHQISPGGWPEADAGEERPLTEAGQRRARLLARRELVGQLVHQGAGAGLGVAFGLAMAAPEIAALALLLGAFVGASSLFQLLATTGRR